MGRTRGRNWALESAAILGWLRIEVPKRRTVDGIWVDCGSVFNVAPGNLRAHIARYHAAEWDQIKATVGTGINSAGTVGADRQQEVTDTDAGAFRDVRANGRKIKTVDDLLRYVKADLTKFEVATSEVTKYEGLARDPDDVIRTHEMFRVFVRLKPKSGPTVPEAIEALIAGAFAKRHGPAVHLIPKTVGDIEQDVIVADTHFGKYAWSASTGGPDYDLKIAEHCVGNAGMELLERGDEAYHPARRVFGFLGDLFHYDTPGGTTTAGTAIERDGRYQKMLEVGSQTLIGLIERSAKTCPTDVYVIPGNHDQILTTAFQLILLAWFRHDRRVAIDGGHMPRKYHRHGANLIGFAHGEKAKEKLPQLMALERPKEWGETTYREIHTGHFHFQQAKWQRPIETIDGVVVRIAPSVGPADDWHVEEGYIGAPRAMETFFYRKTGGLAGMLLSSPDFPAKGAA